MFELNKFVFNLFIHIQDDMPYETKGSSILDHIPIEEAVHKENTIKAGPWNNNVRKHPLISSVVKPSFKGTDIKFIIFKIT